MFIGFSEAESFLRNCRDAVIITHQNPDGDCIGAGFGLKDILEQLGIRSRVICHDEFPSPRYDFITSVGQGEDFEPQTVIAVDIADVKLMGKYADIYGDKDFRKMAASQMDLIKCISEDISAAESLVDELDALDAKLRSAADGMGPAKEYHDKMVPLLEEIRKHVDSLEMMVDDQMWPLPKYRELLFIH